MSMRVATIFKKHKILSGGGDVKESEGLGTVGGDVKWCSYYAKYIEVPWKIKNRIISNSSSG